MMRDIFSNTARRVLRSSKEFYDPMRYWNMRPDPNSDAGRAPERVGFDANYIRAHIAPESSVLELGPGVGRTFASYKAGTRVSTLDISRLYEAQLLEAAKTSSLILEQHFLDDTQDDFPFADGQFDTGVCFQVFIHQPPQVFSHSFSEFSRVCKKAIISVGLHANTRLEEPASSPHVFCHDYILEAAENKKIINNLLLRESTLYFTLESDTRDLWMTRGF